MSAKKKPGPYDGIEPYDQAAIEEMRERLVWDTDRWPSKFLKRSIVTIDQLQARIAELETEAELRSVEF